MLNYKLEDFRGLHEIRNPVSVSRDILRKECLRVFSIDVQQVSEMDRYRLY